MEAVAVRGLPDCAVSAQRAWIVELVTANHEYFFFSWQQTFNWITDYESRITNHKSRISHESVSWPPRGKNKRQGAQVKSRI